MNIVCLLGKYSCSVIFQWWQLKSDMYWRTGFIYFLPWFYAVLEIEKSILLVGKGENVSKTLKG